GTWKVDPKKLSAVIDHIREVEELNDTMVQQIQTHIVDNRLKLNSIREDMNKIDSEDGNVDGFIDIEALRQTLIKFGFKLSRHKFHTLVLLKYETKGTTVKFEQLLDALVPRTGTVLASHASFQILSVYVCMDCDRDLISLPLGKELPLVIFQVVGTMVERFLAATSTDKLTIERVLLSTLLLIIFVVVLEAGLHKLDHFCKKYHKYHEMLNKVTGELMVVGLIYLLVKFVCYFNIIEYGGVQYYSLDAADMLLFFVAVALVLQSLVIFVRLREANAEIDDLTITKAHALVTMAKTQEEAMEVNKALWFKKYRTRSKMRVLMENKLMDAFFHKTYELPSIFSFAKYLREIQDSHIVDLIEVDILGWAMLLILFTTFFAFTGELQQNSAYHKAKGNATVITAPDDQLYVQRIWVFALFVGLLTLGMLAMSIYLRVLNNAVIKHAIKAFLSNEDVYQPENYLATKEDELMSALLVIKQSENDEAEITVDAAIEIMQKRAEEIGKNQKVYTGLAKNSLFIQMVTSSARKMNLNNNTTTDEQDKVDIYKEKMKSLKLPLPFPRKLVQFCLQNFLILNGLYYGMLMSCVFPSISPSDIPKAIALAIPLLINTFFFAPHLLHRFAILSGTWKVERHKLSAVIEHLNEVEEMKNAMVTQINAFLLDKGKEIKHIREELEKIDRNDEHQKDGYIDVERLREVLKNYGFKFSRHKFHTLVLLEYRTKGKTVCFDEVLKTLSPRRATIAL
ncbi:hypothetical protein THRCLA_07192, partial [Thraustotheca clavata]